MSEPSMPARVLLDGLEDMAKAILQRPPQPIREGDEVRVRVAVDGGFQWKNGRVVLCIMDCFQHVKYDIAINGTFAPTVLRVDEVSVRKC